jgi:hypothetical protein
MAEVLTIIRRGESREARFLRRRRLQIALVAAAVEAVFVLSGSIPWWIVLVSAPAAVGLYAWLRTSTAPTVRHLAWIVAVSQLVVVFVPVLAAALTLIAIVLLAIVLAVVLGALLRDRR